MKSFAIWPTVNPLKMAINPLMDISAQARGVIVSSRRWQRCRRRPAARANPPRLLPTPDHRAISVSNQNIRLPGIGSSIALAIEASDLGAMAWAIGTMAVGIVAVDQWPCRPLVAWGHKFRFEVDGGSERPRLWLLAWLRRTRGVRTLAGERPVWRSVRD